MSQHDRTLLHPLPTSVLEHEVKSLVPPAPLEPLLPEDEPLEPLSAPLPPLEVEPPVDEDPPLPLEPPLPEHCEDEGAQVLFEQHTPLSQ